MPDASTLLAFALVAFGMVLSPGPNMIYLVSRTLCQGRMAGLISLGGVALGFLFYMVMSAFGITALLLAVPQVYDGLRIAGVAYLLYLAWQTVGPGGGTPFQVRNLPRHPPRTLFAMGLLTNLLNPKCAVLYLSLLPQFIDPARGSVFLQTFLLGFTQVGISVTVNALIVVTAGTVATFLATRPTWLALQRWLMGTLLAGFAVKMAADARR